MRNSESQADSRNLGWLLAGLLIFALSSPAWALDFDKEIARQERTTVTMVTNKQLKERFLKQQAEQTDDGSDLNVELVKTETVAKNR